MIENLVTNILPSKPFKSYNDIAVLAAQAKGRVERIQVDICDGEYVKNVSWPFTETSKNDFADLWKKEMEGGLDVFMPEMYDIDYTADLMCLSPERYVDTLVQYGFSEIIFHWRSLDNNEERLKQVLGFGLSYSLNIYFAVDIKTNVDEVKNFFVKYARNYPCLHGVQVMGIENIGVQGQEFDARSLNIVKEFRKFFDEELVFDEKGKRWEEGKWSS
jgi:pentose-5-phosphate-3-epimerase